MMISKRLRILSASLFFFLLFILLSGLVHYDFFRGIDYQSMLFIQKIQSLSIDYFFSVLTLLGSSEAVFIFVLAVFLIILISRKRMFLGVFLYILIYPVELMGKLSVYHPKPPVFFNRYTFNFHLPSSYFVSTNYSYPSGHMARTVFLLVIAIFIIRSSFRIGFRTKLPLYSALIAYLFLILISRIYLGEHWFSDCLGALFLGTSVAFFSLVFW